MTSAGPELRVVDNQAEHRYEAWLGDQQAGVAIYNLAPGQVVFLHTEIDPAFEGHGVGGRLVAAALDDVRSRGLGARPICPFVAGFIRDHPEYADLVAQPG